MKMIKPLSLEFLRNGLPKKFNPCSANPTKWSNTLKQFDGNSQRPFDHFVELVLKGLRNV